MLRRRPKRGVAGATAIAVIAALGMTIAAPIPAHEKGYDVFFGTIRSGEDGGATHISGTIFVEVEPHPKEACVPRRPIRLFEVAPGPDRLLRSGRTDRFGRYAFSFPGGSEGREYALKLLRKVIRKDGRHLHFCEAQTASFGL